MTAVALVLPNFEDAIVVTLGLGCEWKRRTTVGLVVALPLLVATYRHLTDPLHYTSFAICEQELADADCS